MPVRRPSAGNLLIDFAQVPGLLAGCGAARQGAAATPEPGIPHRANRAHRCVDSRRVKSTPFAHVVRSALAFALIWWLLARGTPLWAAAGAAGVLAALAALRLAAPAPSVAVRWSRLPRFFAWFVVQSVAGGLDVARRATARDMRLAPGLVEVDLGERAEGAQVLVALVVSLLPGTLAVRLDGRTLRLHALDTRLPVEQEVRRLAREVDRLLRSRTPGLSERE